MRGTHDVALFESLEPRQLLATIAWDGGGGDNLWLNPLNWEGDVLPGEADTALIAALPSAVVYAGGTTTVASVQSAADLAIQSGVLTATGDSTVDGDLSISGGTLLTGTWTQNSDFAFSAGMLDGGDFTVNGRTVWSGGLMLGAGKTIAHGEVEVVGTVQLRRELDLFSSQDWSGVTVNMDTHGSVRLWPGGVLTLRDHSVIEGETHFGFAVGGVFVGGNIRVLDSSIRSRFFAGGPSARVDVVAGTFSLGANGAVGAPLFAQAGTTIDVQQASWHFSFVEGARWWGDGILHVESDLFLNARGLALGAVELGQGARVSTFFDPEPKRASVDTITISGGAFFGGYVTVRSGLLLTNGAINGEITIAADAVARLIENVPGSFFNAGRVINFGTVEFDPAAASTPFSLYIENHGLVRQLSPGNVQVRGFTGDGAVVVETGALVAHGFGSSFELSYNGTLELAAGTTALFRNGSGLGAGARVTGDGTLRFGDELAASQLSGTIENAALELVGAVRLDSPVLHPGLFLINDGARVTLARDFTLSTATAWNGGRISGPGNLIVHGVAPIDVYGTGTDTPTLAGTMILRSTITFRTGTFTVGPAGRIVNEGNLRVDKGTMVAFGPVSGPGFVRKVGFGSYEMGGPGLALSGQTQVRYGSLFVTSGAHTGAVTLERSSASLALGAGPGSMFQGPITGPGNLVAVSGAHTVRGQVDVGSITVQASGTLRLWESSSKHTGLVDVYGALSIGARAELVATDQVRLYEHATLSFDAAGSGVAGSLTAQNSLFLHDAPVLGVQLIGGYKPAAGQSLNLIAGALAMGTFDALEMSPLPPNVLALVEYVPGIIRVNFVGA